MKTKIAVLIMFLLATQGAWAQVMFHRHYGGGADDYGIKVLQTSDGGYLVAAITESFGAGYRDIFLIKTSDLGDTLWTRTIGGTGGEQPSALKVTSDNQFIIAGSTGSKGAGGYDVYLLKIDQNGDTIWTRTYGGIEDEDGCDVIETIDGGYLVVGGTRSFATGSSSMYAIKTNSVGDTLWTKTYTKKSSNICSSVVQLSDSGYFFVGQTLLPGQISTSDCYFVRTDMAGDTIWTKTYGGADYDGAFLVYKENGGNIVISGTTKSFGAGGFDIFLSMFNINGEEIWIKTYGGALDDYGGIFSPTTDGGYIISGYTENYGAGNQDMFLIKTDTFGDTLWTRTFGGYNDEWSGSVIQTLDNGFIISGYSNSFGNGIEVYLVKTNPEGISGLPQIIPQNIQYEVYPNPGNGQFNIEFEDPNSTAMKVEVFDHAGKLVFEKNGINRQGNVYPLSLAGFPSGSYLLQVTTSKGCAVTKLVIQK